MMAVDSSKGTTGALDHALQIDETYEFSAPRFFDFIKDETEEEMKMAERWFDTALSHAPSPFMPRIKTGRSVKLDVLCDFSDAEQIHKAAGTDPEATTCSNMMHDASSAAPGQDTRNLAEQEDSNKEVTRTEGTHHQKQDKDMKSPLIQISANAKPCESSKNAQESISAENPSFVESVKPSDETSSARLATIVQAADTEACTPKAQKISSKGAPRPPPSSKNQTAKKIASAIRNPSALKPKNQTPSLGDKSIKPTSVRRCPRSIGPKNTAGVDFAQENQAIKRQKLEGGRSRQILDVKNRIFPHKSKPGLSNNNSLSASIVKGKDEKNDVSRRKVYVREQVVPFVSMAEMVKKFQSRPREMDLSSNRSLSHDDASSIIQRRQKLTLTHPIEPEFETANRVRSFKVKSTAELEEEMLANIPKFKARPLNKKILEAPSLPALPRSTPQPPEFQEFHLKTMERANQHAGTPSELSSTDSSCHNQGKLHKLTEPKPPRLETLLRARPPKIKTSQELELEELEKMPKFKARPLNKKIFESRGDLGVFCNTKRQLTIPQEFHFATDERMPPPPTTVADLFDKLSLHSEPHHHEQQQIPRITTPNPFHLHTEERGQEKERKFIEEIVRKQLEEERARVPKAKPYPYTTDYPVVPPKPEPKECTRPEAFQLESLVRHEEEMQRKMEERERLEKEEAQMRTFRAQPVLKEDPLPVPEKVRKPLTQVQEFALHVDHRAVDRADFDKKIKEKETMYKRYREEHEAAQKMEEEKAVKQMRRTMVPHALPLPSFANPFLPQKSCKETTKPKSPNLRVLQRKERRHMVGAGHHMR
ncbi:protein TPX2 [Magnolia sinica]|uniref:protein TPX2 n=1 Tax=Magnolia sinica TaxID=86752 RepID=UPI0026591984|nr:protein TPX2 [Magnolia sinica]